MKDAKGNQIAINDVVQLDPEKHRNGFFPGCFMLVTEVKPWGAQGFIAMPAKRGTPPGEAYFRAESSTFIRIGRAEWAPPRGEDEG